MDRRSFIKKSLLAVLSVGILEPLFVILKPLFAQEKKWTFSNRLQLKLHPNVIANSDEFPSKFRIYVPRNLTVSCKKDTSFYIYFDKGD